MFGRILFICFLIVCISFRGPYRSVATPVLSAQPVGVSQTASVSQGSRITAPWLSYEELAAWHLDAYYQVIIDSNIFRPLQKHISGIKINRYQLIGTVEREQETVAYLLDTFTKKIHPVTPGKRLDKFTVKNVTRKSVDLRDKKGVITKLELGTMFLK